MDPTMNVGALARKHALRLTLTTLSSFLLLPTLGCNLDLGTHGHHDPPRHPGVDPEDLTSIAAVVNKTAGPLTVTVIDPPATDVLQPDEAIFYEVSQSREAREFEFHGGESVGSGSLLLLTGGDLPGFATGVLMVSPGDNDGTLAVSSNREQLSPFAHETDAVAPGSSVYLMVNATAFTIGVGISSGSGRLIFPNAHTSIVIEEGATRVVDIDLTVNTPPVGPANVPELTHVLTAPTSEVGRISAFITFVTLQENELAVETRNAGFRRLE